MKIKRLIAVVLAALFCFTLSGCDVLQTDFSGLIAAPKLEGDMYPVQQALEAWAGEDITLKYPVSGDYRSAFIMTDVNSDGFTEAVAFYSVTADSAVTMHINIIANRGDEWKSMGDLSLVANDVESVSFSDLDGDGSKEIIVGWMVYGSIDKQVGVYSFTKDTLTQRVLEKYTNFTCADLNSDDMLDLTVVYLNSTDKVASAKVISFKDDGIAKIGSVGLDGNVSSYSTPVVAPLKNGATALYIDAVKGSGMITEIIWFEDTLLKSLISPTTMENTVTHRLSAVSSRDFSGDGVIDIPLLELLPSTAESDEADKVYITNWCDFDGNKMEVCASTFMNYSDGYCLTIPDSWKNSIHLTRKTESRLRVFYHYDINTGTYGEEIFRIIAVASADKDKRDEYTEEGYTLLLDGESLTYLAKVNEPNDINLDINTLESIFRIIK